MQCLDGLASICALATWSSTRMVGANRSPKGFTTFAVVRYSPECPTSPGLDVFLLALGGVVDKFSKSEKNSTRPEKCDSLFDAVRWWPPTWGVDAGGPFATPCTVEIAIMAENIWNFAVFCARCWRCLVQETPKDPPKSANIIGITVSSKSRGRSCSRAFTRQYRAGRQCRCAPSNGLGVGPVLKGVQGNNWSELGH